MTMNLDELRDWFARRTDKFPHWSDAHARMLDQLGAHPIPATLDAIAGLMPPGWWWSRFETGACGVKWVAGPYGGFASVSIPDTGDELLDRARLAMLAWEAKAKGAGQ
jgi:hypothetical protein